MPTEFQLSLFQWNYSENQIEKMSISHPISNKKNFFWFIYFLFCWEKTTCRRHKYVYEWAFQKTKTVWLMAQQIQFVSIIWMKNEECNCIESHSFCWLLAPWSASASAQWNEKKKSECKYASWLVISCGANKLINGHKSKCFLLNSSPCLAHSRFASFKLNLLPVDSGTVVLVNSIVRMSNPYAAATSSGGSIVYTIQNKYDNN